MNRPTLIAAGAAALAALACSLPSSDSSSGSSGRNLFASFAAFEPVEFTGEQDGVIDLPEGVTQAMVTATHDGEHFFSIAGLDANNETTGDLLINALGAYEGVTILGAHSTAEPVRLQVTADGAWTITLAPLADAPALPESGVGDGVYRYEGNAATWQVMHDGEHYFSIDFYTDADMGLSMLVAEVGAYDGEVAAGAGPALVVILADGSWTIAPQ